MERIEIIKAFECCTRGRKSNKDSPCLECPYNECNIVGGTGERQTSGTCQGWLMKDSLALIKELTEEVTDLTANVLLKGVENLTLTEENDAQAETIKSLIETIKDVKADTVREMQERFKELMGNEYTSCGFCNAQGYWSVKAVKDNIDRIANEILNKTEDEKK